VIDDDDGRFSEASPPALLVIDVASSGSHRRRLRTSLICRAPSTFVAGAGRRTQFLLPPRGDRQFFDFADDGRRGERVASCCVTGKSRDDVAEAPDACNASRPGVWRDPWMRDRCRWITAMQLHADENCARARGGGLDIDTASVASLEQVRILRTRAPWLTGRWLRRRSVCLVAAIANSPFRE
jgi:hypothetical protein